MEIEAEELRISRVDVTDEELRVTLCDGRIVMTPLWWYPKLSEASPAQRANFEIMPVGIHWPELDEDLSIAGMLSGKRRRGARVPGGE